MNAKAILQAKHDGYVNLVAENAKGSPDDGEETKTLIEKLKAIEQEPLLSGDSNDRARKDKLAWLEVLE
jgi:hypothetical protein